MTKDPFPLLVIVRLLVALCVIFLVVTFVLAPMDRGRASDDGETGPTATVPLVPSAVALSILVLLFVAAEARSVYHREVARRQREILMAAAHELKSPLSALQSVGENMAGGIISSREHVRNYGDIVCRESKRLASAVEEILSHAVTSSGTQPAEATTVEKVDIPALIDDVLNTARNEADRRGAIVFLRVAPDLPLFPGSFTLLFEALHNLLINAIHNGREGNRIVIGARQEEMSNRRHVNLVVRDHGPGIDPSRLQTVFQLTGRGSKPSLGEFYHDAAEGVAKPSLGKFYHDGMSYRASSQRSAESPSHFAPRTIYQATSEGVGLYLVRRAVRHHAGVLRLWSRGAFILFDYRETAPKHTEERPLIQVTEPFVKRPETQGCVFRLLLPYSDDTNPRMDRKPDWALRKEDFRDAAP